MGNGDRRSKEEQGMAGKSRGERLSDLSDPSDRSDFFSL